LNHVGLSLFNPLLLIYTFCPGEGRTRHEKLSYTRVGRECMVAVI